MGRAKDPENQQLEDLMQAVQERDDVILELNEAKKQLGQSQDNDHVRMESAVRATRERAEFEYTISGLERQLEESQESGSSMRRRLEKLHTDLASAAGQLVSEKSTWKAQEEEYRAKCDSFEAQIAVHVASQSQLEEELSNLKVGAREQNEARLAVDEMKSMNMTLDETVRNLQNELAEQQSLAARFERDFHDAKETARLEIQRVRLSTENRSRSCKASSEHCPGRPRE